ncbi:hypothetical protein ASG31_08305 [Chryseobacterium sp. Leaf404]|uniref:hypothetical protein n=1 Tax=unclassified Chryseobacterium TaxID=2593645 RepID=UPI0006F3BF8E|nr:MULTISPECIES: hypothetical protein [unclassified Chryseobacterium]KQT17403.1 hypothetical protein ASG31_08305 [Chryseobacterium sp. Leaf404]
MILSFKTKINDKKTHFPEKILLSIEQNKLSDEPLNFGIASKDYSPKIHTIRKDDKNRWKVGVMIDFFINARTKDMFRFAPKIQVVSIQEFEIKYFGLTVQILIDEEWFGDAFFDQFKNIECHNLDLETLAQNDGFASLDEFFEYFNEDFKGKIIHWTNFKYT